MPKKFIPIGLMMALLIPAAAIADDLTRMIQKDLVALGYDPGNIQGEMSTETVVAISKFQAENNMEITGEASPQLAGVINDETGSGALVFDEAGDRFQPGQQSGVRGGVVEGTLEVGDAACQPVPDGGAAAVSAGEGCSKAGLTEEEKGLRFPDARRDQYRFPVRWK